MNGKGGELDMILYFDDKDFAYDLINIVGDFLGNMIIDICDMIDDYSDRKPLLRDNKFALESVISAYLCRKEPNGLKDWLCQFYKENEKVKILLETLFTGVEADINVVNMQVDITYGRGKV